ncbi:hypothetical protein BDV18DRAFT_137463 [Aspergillus unguis]
MEVILSVLHHTADFTGVDSLLSVSPYTFAVFYTNVPQLIKDLLAACLSTSPNCTIYPGDLASFISQCTSSSPSIDDSLTSTAISSTPPYQNCSRTYASRIMLPSRPDCLTAASLSWIEEFRVYRAPYHLLERRQAYSGNDRHIQGEGDCYPVRQCRPSR